MPADLERAIKEALGAGEADRAGEVLGAGGG